MKHLVLVLLLVANVCNGADYYQGAGGVLLPDPHVTPGKADPRVNQENIQETVCKSGYTKSVRAVPASVKKAVMREYGLDPAESGKYEIDHLISLELGGSNNAANLWPQPYAEPPPGARQKDVLETYLKREVCAGRVSLAEAQSQIATNWYIAYQAMLQEEKGETK